MTTIQSFMTADHRRCDDLLAATEEAIVTARPDAARAAFAEFRAATLAHFTAEEDLLFPAFEQKTGMRMGPTQVMRMEHEQMRGLLNDAADALEAGEIGDYGGNVETLLIMIQQHNMKEENVLYPMCDEHLGDGAPTLVAELAEELGAR